MKANRLVAMGIVGLALAVSTAWGAGDSASERRASVMRAKAAELRMQAEAMRDAKGNNPGKAKELDAEADKLIERANSVDGIAWPPKE